MLTESICDAYKALYTKGILSRGGRRKIFNPRLMNDLMRVSK